MRAVATLIVGAMCAGMLGGCESAAGASFSNWAPYYGPGSAPREELLEPTKQEPADPANP